MNTGVQAILNFLKQIDSKRFFDDSKMEVVIYFS
jgi:hypothetical protein